VKYDYLDDFKDVVTLRRRLHTGSKLFSSKTTFINSGPNIKDTPTNPSIVFFVKFTRLLPANRFYLKLPLADKKMMPGTLLPTSHSAKCAAMIELFKEKHFAKPKNFTEVYLD
jgi:hypothetical protein